MARTPASLAGTAKLSLGTKTRSSITPDFDYGRLRDGAANAKYGDPGGIGSL